jgi:hypothetical protein
VHEVVPGSSGRNDHGAEEAGREGAGDQGVDAHEGGLGGADAAEPFPEQERAQDEQEGRDDDRDDGEERQPDPEAPVVSRSPS